MKRHYKTKKRRKYLGAGKQATKTGETHMSTGSKVGLGLAVAAGIGVGLFFLLRKKKPKKPIVKPTVSAGTPTGTPTGGGGGVVSGDAVTCAKNLQQYLNDNGYTDRNGNKLAVDGQWGTLSDSAYNKLLEAKGWTAERPTSGGICAAWNFVKSKTGAADTNANILANAKVVYGFSVFTGEDYLPNAETIVVAATDAEITSESTLGYYATANTALGELVSNLGSHYTFKMQGSSTIYKVNFFDVVLYDQNAFKGYVKDGIITTGLISNGGDISEKILWYKTGSLFGLSGLSGLGCSCQSHGVTGLGNPYYGELITTSETVVYNKNGKAEKVVPKDVIIGKVVGTDGQWVIMEVKDSAGNRSISYLDSRFPTYRNLLPLIR